MSEVKNKKKSLFVKIFDIFFIMILCFLTLLTTMIIKGAGIFGNVVGGNIYSIEIITFSVTVICFFAYLFFIIPNSNKELRKMIHSLYDNEDKTEKVDNEKEVR
jgi:uncharacterized BrkB/YihY/UPF0761 family membrane protein